MNPSDMDEVQRMIAEMTMPESGSSHKEEERASTPVLGGRVRYALQRVVAFREPIRLHANAARRFKERRFHEAFRAAKEAIARIKGESRDYVETSMALAIASARRILETSEGTTAWAGKVSRLLREAMRTFENGSFADAATLLNKLGAAVSSLYAYEMDRHRNHVAAWGRAIAETSAMGGDTTLPSRKLRRAVLALAQDDRETYLEVVDEVDAMVRQARDQRVEAIHKKAEGVKGPLREGLVMTLETGDFISSNFLLLASRETALQDTQAPIRRGYEEGGLFGGKDEDGGNVSDGEDEVGGLRGENLGGGEGERGGKGSGDPRLGQGVP